MGMTGNEAFRAGFKDIIAVNQKTINDEMLSVGTVVQAANLGHIKVRIYLVNVLGMVRLPKCWKRSYQHAIAEFTQLSDEYRTGKGWVDCLQRHIEADMNKEIIAEAKELLESSDGYLEQVETATNQSLKDLRGNIADWFKKLDNEE